jgi:hypothetical protein
METQILSLPAFEDLLDRWGDEIERWPAEWHAPARQLIAANAAARASLEESRRLRELLRDAPPVQAPPGLLDRILKAAAASSQPAAAPPPPDAPLQPSLPSPAQHHRAPTPRRAAAPRGRG